MPFHKLSQWLAYSLSRSLEDAGIASTGLDELTGLAEYRNGGLFLDLGVLALREPGWRSGPLPVEHAAVVEWRALTVALLDRIAPLVRSRLGSRAAEMPLARVLQGGTWAAAASYRRAASSRWRTAAARHQRWHRILKEARYDGQQSRDRSRSSARCSTSSRFCVRNETSTAEFRRFARDRACCMRL